MIWLSELKSLSWTHDVVAGPGVAEKMPVLFPNFLYIAIVNVSNYNYFVSRYMIWLSGLKSLSWTHAGVAGPGVVKARMRVPGKEKLGPWTRPLLLDQVLSQSQGIVLQN